MTLQPVEVTYHREAGTWWAESDQLPGFSAWAEELDSVQAFVLAECRSRFAAAERQLIERDESGALLPAAMPRSSAG
ncbi:DUF1902 domain-containing protein [Agrococcus sp. KRD186]|jgi:hypothetical protein|uniref:DUF1902 domain-containing protein n=1 Tax=Agrococcus sp. KRD186 TaxID=2729730 RepID=UPI0019D2C9AA|nr:DUF1902 domain-containing protein [Agrococcus sp. KRD186]